MPEITPDDCRRCEGTGRIEPFWPVGPGGAHLSDYECSTCKGTGKLPTSRPVMNSPADEAEARDRANTAPRQADPAAPGRGETGASSGSEARPVTATEHLISSNDQRWDSPESVITLILLNYQREQNEAKLRSALLMLVNEAYQQGRRNPVETEPDEVRRIARLILEEARNAFPANHCLVPRVLIGLLRAALDSSERASIELCPHGMPLAENICGPCSKGAPNAPAQKASAPAERYPCACPEGSCGRLTKYPNQYCRAENGKPQS